MLRRVFFLALLTMSLAYAGACLAAPAVESPPPSPVAAPGAAKKEIPDKPAAPKQIETRTPVFVEHHGSDNVGGRLAYHLKETMEKSALFRLTSKDEKKLKAILFSKDEFNGRPNMSSIYTVVWAYSENEGTLKYYLASDVGLVHAASVKEEAEALAGRTHEVLSSYGYLFE